MTDRFADYGRPRRVDGGLRARSTRGAIGVSWWSQRFVEVLESFALGTRLTRGRSYARAGQVVSLTVAPGQVTAVVQGSRPKPYQVRIALPVFPADTWTRIEAELAGQAFFSARLLAGDLPAELEELFASVGAVLFPTGVDELDQECSCPDFAVPCKHLAAAFYLLAEVFDADPFELLHWRGRHRVDLLTRLRQLRAAASTGTDREATPDGPDRAAASGGSGREVTTDGPDRAAASDGSGRAATSEGPERAATSDGAPVAVAAVGAYRALAGQQSVSLSATVDRFWVAPVPLPARPTTLATDPELLLRQLGAPGAAIGGPGLVQRLRRAYQVLADPVDEGSDQPSGRP
ncbi:SWIM zinc finger family protein [Micromonospora sp. NPDC000207]|uniref:SWIM zinc finger family protein n=1 Tax=Micromonospora sp. NPDC000207 TaxID=3154246 RepID=UPI0033276DCC